MAEDKKPVDLKNIDIKDIGVLFKSLGSNPTTLFVGFGFILSILFGYLIYGMMDNQTKFNTEQAKFNQTTVELNVLTKKFDKTIKGNKAYFSQLFASPKTDDELSARITKLVSNYNLKLITMNLEKKVKNGISGIGLEVSGSYMNLLKFSKELNKNVAASRVNDLEIKSKNKSKTLFMKVTIAFTPPPNPDSIPKINPATVSINSIKNLAKNTSFYLDTMLGWFIASSHAEESMKKMTDFQKALYEAKKAGLYDFEFTNKAGRTMLYLTGIPKEEAEAALKQKKMTDFQKALYEAKKAGFYDFEFTNKAGRTMLYLTGLPKEILATLPEIEVMENNLILPPLQASEEITIITEKLATFEAVETEIIKESKDLTGQYKKAGFVESDPFGGAPEPANTQTETDVAETDVAEPKNEPMRDPFAPPEVRKIFKKSSSGADVSEEEEAQYYLSGVLVSDEMSLCIIITPDGESKIYAPGDKINKKVMLTNIGFDSIQINKLNKQKVIALGEQVN